MQQMILHCEVCQQKLILPQSAGGKRAQCPSCGYTFSIPGTLTASAAASYTPPPPRTVAKAKHQPEHDLADREWTEPKPKRDKPRRPRQPVKASSPILAFSLILVVVLAVVGASIFVGMNQGNNGNNFFGNLNDDDDDDAAPNFPRRGPRGQGQGNKGPLPAVPLNRDVLERVKSATVYVKVQVGMDSATGTGFLIHRDGQTAYFITNQHVISPDLEKRRERNPFEFGPRFAPMGPRLQTSISLVLGSGTGQERTVRASILTSSREPDLALLAADIGEFRAEPLSIEAPRELVETQRLYFFGFPFGAELAEGRANPAVQVKQGTLSAIQRDFRGGIRKLQVECDLNPGNSGGPAVDAEGRLVGVAESILLGTNIGNLIHPQQIQALIQNKEKGAVQFFVKQEGQQFQVEAVAPVIDFRRSITGAYLLIKAVALDQDFELNDNPNGSGQLIQKAQRINMIRKPEGYVAQGPLDWKEDKAFKLAYQVIYEQNDRKTDTSAIHQLEFKHLAGLNPAQPAMPDNMPDPRPPIGGQRDRGRPNMPPSTFDAPPRTIGKIFSPKDIPDLLVYWSFDKSDGDTVADEASQSYEATIQNGSIVPGVRGKAVHLTGNDSYVSFEGDAFNYKAREPFTYACWVRTHSPGVIFAQRDIDNGGPLISVNVDMGGMVIAQIRDDRRTDMDMPAEIRGKRITNGEWHHIALIRKRSGDMVLYIDGKPGFLMANMTTHNPLNGSSSVTTSARAWGADLHWAKSQRSLAFKNRAFLKGELDECCIFKRDLTEAEIMKLAGASEEEED